MWRRLEPTAEATGLTAAVPAARPITTSVVFWVMVHAAPSGVCCGCGQRRSQLELRSRVAGNELHIGIHGLVFLERVLGDQPGQVPPVQATGHLMPGRYRAEGAGV